MNTPIEIFDIVDESDRVIGQAPRGEIHQQRLRHRAVHVFVFDAEGRLYIQKRSMSKDSFPGRYDSSASGHVDSSESYDAAALRETREEISLEFLPGKLRKHFSVAACEETSQEFVWVYSARGNYQPVFNPIEIESARFWTVTEIEQHLASHPDDWAPAFRLVFREFKQRRC